MSFKSSLKYRVDYIEKLLKEYMPEEKGYQKTIFEAMNYSLKAGGKRLRPILTLEACRIVGGNEEDVIPFAIAIEMIHTYSLIHDDLPALDDDDLRRGRPTNHKVYGDAMAILAGDGLLNYAFEIMLKSSIGKENPAKYLNAINEIDGYEVVNVDDLIQLLQDKKKDDILHCKVLSDGEMKHVDIKILT